FFRKHVGDKERDIIRRVVIKAAADGKSEAMVYSFPSSFCTDSGPRSILASALNSAFVSVLL
ncbi:hypothetical protein ACC760_37935, partial [Rhizobium ruizarguesonis]